MLKCYVLVDKNNRLFWAIVQDSPMGNSYLVLGVSQVLKTNSELFQFIMEINEFNKEFVLGNGDVAAQLFDSILEMSYLPTNSTLIQVPFEVVESIYSFVKVQPNVRVVFLPLWGLIALQPRR